MKKEWKVFIITYRDHAGIVRVFENMHVDKIQAEAEIWEGFDCVEIISTIEKGK